MSQPDNALPADFFLDLDRNGPVPLYHQLSARLKEAIHDGSLAPGAKLENEISLSERLGISRPTIRRAIAQLVDEGMLVRRRGVGTQVVHGKINRKVELTSLYDDLANSGQHPTTQLLSHGFIRADEKTAEALGLQVGEMCLQITRLRKADGVPLALLNNVLPPSLLDLEVAQLEQYGLYQLLRMRGVTQKVAKQQIGARSATAAEGRQLDLPRGAAILTMSRTAFDVSGTAIEYGQHCYRPDRYSFEVTLVNR